MKKRRAYEKRPVKNLEIRGLIASNGITYKEIAEKCFVSQSTLSQWFQDDLRVWQRAEVLKAIAEIKAERGDNEKADKEDGTVRNYLGNPLERNVGDAPVEIIGGKHGRV